MCAFFLALAFLAQSYLIQSHVHPFFGQHALTWSSGAAGDSPADCPLCQADMLSGAYLTPSVPQVPMMLARAWTRLHIVASRLYSFHRQHGWQGRAPPLL